MSGGRLFVTTALLFMLAMILTPSTSLASTIPPSMVEGRGISGRLAEDYTTFDRCNPEPPTLTTQEWAACSAAYNVDRLRSEVAVVSFLVLLLLAATSFGVWIRKR